MLQSPFHELYLGETVSEERFADLFSPFLVRHCQLLFKPGNVFLIGAQGSGKTMLLRLLNSDTRIAYHQKGLSYPVTEHYSGDFVACEINIMRSGALEFGQRFIPGLDQADQEQILPLYFGDFLNCWLIRDLVDSIQRLNKAQVANGPNISITLETVGAFLENLSNESSLMSLFENVTSFQQIVDSLSSRIKAYRDFFHFNVDDLPVTIKSSKTPPGFAVSQFVKLLKESGVIGEQTTIFARIDQADDILRVVPSEHEVLVHRSRTRVFAGFAEVINRMIGLRDPYVSYRLAARPSSIQNKMRIFGTDSGVEVGRNFTALDIDQLLLRSERGPGLAPAFFEDVFRRRLVLHKFEESVTVREVFGKQLSPEQKAGTYMKSNNALNLPAIYTEKLTTEVAGAVELFASKSALEWRFAGAWAQQRSNKDVTATEIASCPWRAKQYWIKERIQQGLLQVASSNKQRMIWGGEDDIIQLGGNSVLPFLTLCQEVWDRWIRTIPAGEKPNLSAEPWIPTPIQFDGIHAASVSWHEKLSLASGSDLYMLFADHVAANLRRMLREDIAMSYPGGNGFSLLVEELSEVQNEDVRRALSACVDFGILVELDHTTKYRDGKKRKKYYFSPILCPHYQLPHTRTKEPRYVRLGEVRQWLLAVGIRSDVPQSRPENVTLTSASIVDTDDSQLSLFELGDQ